MRFSPTLVTAFLAGSALASSISPRRAAAAAVGVEKRACDCNCRANCGDDCGAFGGGSGGDISVGLCTLTCADSCGCNVNKPCTNLDSAKEICDKLQAIPNVDPQLSAQIDIMCLAVGVAG